MLVENRRRRVICLATALLLGAMAVTGGGAEAQPARPGSEANPSFREPDGTRFAADRIIVKPEPTASEADVRAINRRNDARIEEQIPRTRLDVVELPEDLPVQQAVRRYENSPDIEYAEPDFLLSPSQTNANDPGYSELYGLNNTGQTGGADGADIDAPEAWASTTGSADTTVAVIDTGVDVEHPDLQNNIWVNEDEIPGNGMDDDGNGYVDDVNGWDFYNDDNTVYDSADGDNHGTHVAGTIAAEGNNGTGVTGVNWQAGIMPLKFLGPKGGYVSDAVEAINYAVANGAPISNNSWGGGGYSQALKDAIDRADSSGHLFVAAAGNGGSDGVGDDNDATPSYPASYDSQNIVSVAATDARDDLASFSNFGAESVDLAAPGVRILSTLPGEAYGYYSGTSMATPHVAGAAALVASMNPEMHDYKIKRRLLDSAQATPSLSTRIVTGGRLNAAEALGGTATEPSLSAGRSTLVFGSGTTLSGELASATGEPVGGQEVILQRRPAGDRSYSRLAKRTTASDGTFEVTGVKPERNTDYRVRYAGSATEALEPSLSPGKRINVRVRVGLSVAEADLDLGRSRPLAGRVLPEHQGSVRLLIRRNGEVIDRESAALSEDSRYRYVYKPPRPGRYTVSALFPKDADHLGKRSPLQSFKVVR